MSKILVMNFSVKFINNNWYTCEPEIYPISNLQKDVIENKVPYLLYYTKLTKFKI